MDRSESLEPHGGFPKAKLADGASLVKVGQIIEYLVDDVTTHGTAFEQMRVGLCAITEGRTLSAALNPRLPVAAGGSLTAFTIQSVGEPPESCRVSQTSLDRWLNEAP